jgi:hypothetical protein
MVLVEKERTVGYSDEIMKKLILSVVVAAFAFAVQAGGDAACSEKSGSCCAAKQQVSTDAKAQCPMAKQQAAKAQNAGAKQVSVKQPLKSPKAMS